MDDDIPIVATSKHIVVNTITAADDYLRMIQPSPSAVPVYETNTYYSTVDFSKTINDEETTKVINTKDVITQVIVTESLPHGQPISQLIDQSEEDELLPSDYGNDAEEQNYIRKTNAIDVNPTRIDQRPAGNTIIPLHLYATKTYLTTFTYFTTLLQNAAGNDGEISTTVDSHTRVIENVITESIASSMIPMNVLSSISKNLFDSEKNDLKTRIVLNNGQKLEITAANILKPVDYATATKLAAVESNDLEVAANDVSPASVLLSSEEAENFVSDPAASEENIIAQQPPIKLPSSKPRPKPVSSNTGPSSLKIPSLLNSISMPNFSALGPVINAMAGLLQTNFGSQSITKVLPPAPLIQPLPPTRYRPNAVDQERLPQPLPLFSQESQELILSQTDGKNTHPLYIPVRGDPNHSNSGEIHHHHHQHQMMGSGIAISPGDVITANSDVIVGKPSVIGPKIPSNIKNPVEIAGMEAPPPFVPLKTPQRPSSFVKDIKSNGNLNYVTIKKGDDYIGPVPPKEINVHSQQQQKPIPLNSFPRQPAPQNLQKVQPNIPPMMRPNDNSAHQQSHQNSLLQKPAPTQETQINNHYVKIHHQGGNQKPQFHNIRNPNNNYRDQEFHRHQELPKFNRNHNPFQGPPSHKEHHSHHQQPPRQQFNENTNYHFSNQHLSQNNAHNNKKPSDLAANIIEIQKIPEVYSTDLPIITVNNQHHFKPNSGGQSVTHELPEILEKPTKGQPLLVDIQPSQVANVVIPHGSSSILVFGGVHKAHKTGQYFNDPSPHGNGEVGIKSVNLLADIEGSKYHGSSQNGQKVHYDDRDNIIIASENIPHPVNSPGLNILVGNNIKPTISKPPPDFIHHSVNVVPNSIIRFHPDPSENYYRPTTQQLINQQKQQQIQIDQQLRQKEIDNQKRIEIENQKRQEFTHYQKIIEQEKKNEEQHIKQIELDRKREYDRQKQIEYEQRQKQIEQHQKEIEHQKRVDEEKNKQQYEHQQNVQQDLKLRHQYEIQQRHQQEMKLKQQQSLSFNVRPPSLILSNHSPVRHESQGNSDSGFIILSSNYGSQLSNQVNQLSQGEQGPFMVSPTVQPTKTPQRDEGADNETDNDGEVVQESIIRPKLPSGLNHESFEDEDVKVVEDYDNFVYHKITAASTSTTSAPSTQQPSPTSTTQKPQATSTQPTRRSSSYVPMLTARGASTTERNSPVKKPKPYPNLQFDDLPYSVNDLQPTHRPINLKFQRIPTIGAQFKPNYNVQQSNTISQSMQPPTAPKISRRPTTPFHRTTFKISMPINPMPDDTNVKNNMQTEEPFNPKYTEDVPTKPSLTTQATTQKTSQSTNHKSVIKTTTETTTDTTSTTKSDLNLGEVEAENRNKTLLVDDNFDIFDSKETVHPLNHGFVKNKNEMDDIDLMPPSIRKPYHTIVRLPETTTSESTGLRFDVSSMELKSMKPPAPAQIPQKSIAHQFDNVVNTKPPTSVLNDSQFESSRIKPPYDSIERPVINRLPSTTKSPYTIIISSRENATTLGPFNRTRFTTQKQIEKPETLNVVLRLKQGERKDIVRNNEDLIIGSVETVHNEHTIKPFINATPVLSTESSISILTTALVSSSIIRQRTSVNRERGHSSSVSDEKKLAQNKTKSFPDPIKISTKYITNTKTITLARTKTEVINRSHGIPFTTTRVQTATVFETVTETETLLKPTTITNIQPTSTYTSIVRGTLLPTNPTTTEEIVEGFVSDEDIEEFIINYDEKHNDTTINRVNSGEVSKDTSENESIFVVMTDKKKGSVFDIDSSIISPSLHNHTVAKEIDDVSRDEEETNDGADHILLGGILIASPPQLNKSQQGAAVTNYCFPECKSSKNEYCHRVLGQMKCDCRPGFARMFPDRPCKRKKSFSFSGMTNFYLLFIFSDIHIHYEDWSWSKRKRTFGVQRLSCRHKFIKLLNIA